MLYSDDDVCLSWISANVYLIYTEKKVEYKRDTFIA